MIWPWISKRGSVFLYIVVCDQSRALIQIIKEILCYYLVEPEIRR
jgi:hypothetical protein